MPTEQEINKKEKSERGTSPSDRKKREA